jgi:hypothetical protein
LKTTRYPTGNHIEFERVAFVTCVPIGKRKSRPSMVVGRTFVFIDRADLAKILRENRRAK